MADKEGHTSVSVQGDHQRTQDTMDAHVNSSGHVQELKRHFTIWSLAGVGLSVGNVWPAVGGSILVAIYNGGPPGSYCLCYEDCH